MSKHHVVPTVPPVDGQPNLLRLARLWSGNALSCFPRQVYEEPLTCWHILGKRLAFVTNPDALQAILVDASKLYPKSPMETRALSRVFGDSIFSSHGPEWKWLRGLIAPHFSRSRMLQQVPRIVSEIEHALEKSIPNGQSSVVQAHRLLQRPTSRVISQILFGDRASLGADELLSTTADHLMQSRWEVLYGLLRMPSWMPCPSGTRNTPAAQKVRCEIGRQLQQPGQNTQNDYSVLTSFATAISTHGGRPIDEAQSIDNLMSLFFAGFETVAVALSWNIYLLATHQSWQDRIAAEAKKVCGNGPVKAQHIEHLVATRSAFQEAMRLYPPIPIITRIVETDDGLLDRRIVEGTNCVLPIYAIHRHRSHWDAPDSFRPERFMASKRRPTRHAFMPFGAGPRTCPGAQLAMIEGTAALATLVRHVRIRPVDDYVPEPVARILLRPVDGMPIRFERRAAGG